MQIEDRHGGKLAVYRRFTAMVPDGRKNREDLATHIRRTPEPPDEGAGQDANSSTTKQREPQTPVNYLTDSLGRTKDIGRY
jgi:hypothetical protein